MKSSSETGEKKKYRMLTAEEAGRYKRAAYYVC